MANNKELQQALAAAFDVCLEVRDFTGNVIAGTDGPADPTDRRMNLKAKKYIRWYKKQFAGSLNK